MSSPVTPVPDSVIVVGASVAGMHFAERLRGFGFGGAITLVGAEPHLPYSRPPLSKAVLVGTSGPDDVLMYDKQRIAELDLDLRLGATAVSADGTTVKLADGSTVTGDVLVVATGVTPRRIPGQPDDERVLTLRTLDDSLALRSRLADASSIAIIGGGLIGNEVASAARDLGKSVTVLEVLPLPMQRLVGTEAARRFARLYASHGIDLRTETFVRGIDPSGSSVRVLLDRDDVEADVVLVAIGGIPNSEWLTGSTAGIECDEVGRVVGRADTYAIGDVAAWPDTRGQPRRREHWTNAQEQAAVVAAHLAHAEDELPPPLPPYVWTDQFHLKIQIIGEPEHGEDCVETEGPGQDGVKGTVLAYASSGRLVGAILFGAPRRMALYTRHVAAGTPVDELGAVHKPIAEKATR